MKITKIELDGYYQFKNVKIDLTYPKGHEKEGKPLDKVCFIGQSGTGKTSLLRLIKWFVSKDRSIGENIKLPVPEKTGIAMEFELFDLHYRLSNNQKDLEYVSYRRNGKGNGKISFKKWEALFTNYLKQIKPYLINYPTELISKRPPPGSGKKETYLDKLEPRQVIDFAFEDIEETWHFLLKDVRKHRAQALLFDTEISALVRKGGALQEIKKKKKEYNKWLLQHPDPLRVLADQCLDPILSRLELKIDPDISKESILDLAFIQLRTIEGEEVPAAFWSTGTWQLVQTVIPLYQLKPKNAIILMDEPERSLYPDFQTTIIDTYVNLAPESQFFFATHSPLIASQFEPWEVIELKFDYKNNRVYQDLHCKGENHKDNYKYYPEYLSWDSNLMRIFDLDNSGGKKRRRAIEDLADMEIRLKEMKKQGTLDSKEAQQLLADFLTLSDKLDWSTDK